MSNPGLCYKDSHTPIEEGDIVTHRHTEYKKEYVVDKIDYLGGITLRMDPPEITSSGVEVTWWVTAHEHLRLVRKTMGSNQYPF